MTRAREQLRTALLVLFVTGGALLASLAGRYFGEHRALLAERQRGQEQLELYAGRLQAFIDRYRAVPTVLALDPELRELLARPEDGALRERVNRKLEHINGLSRASTLTLIDHRGVGIAASNWRQTRSNVGYDYAFRPYYRDALRQGSARFYGVGVTTGIPGYFLSQAVRDPAGAILGVVVIKIELLPMEQEWASTRDRVLLADRYDIVFLANRPDWRYRAMRPLDERVRDELARTQKYADRQLQGLRYRSHVVPGIGRLARFTEPAGEPPRLWQSRPLPAEAWTLHLLADTRPAQHLGVVAAVAAGGAWLALSFLALFVQQRRRLERLRRRSRAELEALVKQHAQALRTAQDSVVQAALGRGGSLEHLPQGVSVVDADLRLVAWNRRYVEIFRYPQELLQVGRPIEDLLRYNARRGLLGPHPEDAVQRRLQHLRARTPYVHERERPDGTVLEIRGNPLPDGGFVTAYTDITSYKAAARDLRTLATTLERRIEERTRDLEAARQEAEQANRSKTRFVAAVVHDLMQPLNAARLFLAALQQRASDDSHTRELVTSIERALHTQEEILSTLMDISRLESGTLEVRARDFALAPLLQALGREFAAIASSRGQKLRWRASAAIVHSDEALLRRILQNFLSNAVRYNRPSGRVLFGVRRVGDTALRIEVWDTGPGIPQSQRAAIFEEFRRLDSGRHTPDRGAGLGLAIADRIARLLQHPIGLRSWPGKGSVFSVTVPRGRGAPLPDAMPLRPAAATDAESALSGRMVWYVDDEPEAREGARALLQRWGCFVRVFADSRGVLETAVGERPDLLLMDYRLGEHDGLQLLAELQALWSERVPAVLVSAEPDPDLPHRAQAAGVAFLRKPMRPSALRALMTQLLVSANPEPHAPRPAP